MIKSLKDFRRRSVETVLETVGKTDKTVDNEFEAHVAKFQTMLQDMNECGAALHSYLANQKVMFTDAKELAVSLSRIFQVNSLITSEEWPNTVCEMKCISQAKDFAKQWVDINDVSRSSSAAVCSEQALDRLKSAVVKMGPEIEAGVKERNIKQKDYDSYKRRLKALEAKKEAYDTEGKSSSKAAIENAEEIEKFQRKVEAGLESYNYQNEKTKADIITAKKNHDQLMDHVITTTLVCQAELFSRAAVELEAIIRTLPDQRVVQQIRQRIHDFEALGGVKAEKPEGGKGLSILGLSLVGNPTPAPASSVTSTNSHASTGGVTAAGPQRNSGVSVPNPAASNAARANAGAAAPRPASVNPFADTGNPFADDSPPTAPTSPSVPSAPTAPPLPNVNISPTLVEALFDHEAEEDDELDFKTGDLVEVLETGDNGWWKGRCHGKEGLFPVNYVKPHNS